MPKTASSHLAEVNHLRVDVHVHPREFPQDLVTLFEQASAGNVESSADWFANLVDHVYPADGGIRFYILRKAGVPVCALPVRLSKKTLGWHLDSLSNYYTSLFAPLIAPGVVVADMAFLFKAIKRDFAPLSSLRLAPMAPESEGFDLLVSALESGGFRAFKFFCFGNWYLPVKDDWQTYLQKRDGAVRSTIKRMGKKFAAAGGTLQIVRDGVDLERAVAAYQRVYAMSWKQPEPYPDFVPGLIRTCAAHGWLRLGVAWLDDQPVAAQLWIVANGKANIYKLAYDENFKTYAPGTLLTAMLMEHAIDVDKVREIDYLIGDDPYKATWMSDRRERWGIMAYNPRSILGLMGIFREILASKLKNFLAQHTASDSKNPI